MSTYRWSEQYSVNVAALDKQHRQLFDTINELDKALKNGDGNSAVGLALSRLADYSLVHFAAEESLMERHGFPGLPTHRAEHDAFRKKIAALLADHKAGKPGVPVLLLFFMQSWLKQHIKKTDKLYSAYLNARGVR